MKKNNLLIISGLSGLCIASLAAAYFLTREPKEDFIPSVVEADSTTDTWEDIAEPDPVAAYTEVKENVQIKGTTSDHTQVIEQETEQGTVTNFSGSSTKPERTEEKPTEPPVITDDITDPDRQPEYDDTVPVVNPAPDVIPQETTPAGDATPSDTDHAASPTEDSGHSGQVYDPVFGWIDGGNTYQDTIDSDGDINKQIGTMGGQ